MMVSIPVPVVVLSVILFVAVAGIAAGVGYLKGMDFKGDAFRRTYKNGWYGGYNEAINRFESSVRSIKATAPKDH